MVIRNWQGTDELVDPATVTVREVTLFDAVCAALESGEFRQVRCAVTDGAAGRCVLGVALEVMDRAGTPSLLAVHPQWCDIARRAGAMLGHLHVIAANDAGVPFRVLAPALRAARDAVERGEWSGEMVIRESKETQ